jgi:hypothetical protein
MGKYKFIDELKEELLSIPNVTVVKTIQVLNEKKKKNLYSRRSFSRGTR